MNPDANFGVGNPPEEDVVADEIEQGLDSDTGDTEVSLEPPIVDDEKRADVNTLRCDEDDRAGAPLEARIPNAQGEEKGEEEVNSGDESADSQTTARFARAHTAYRKAHGLRGALSAAANRAWTARQDLESDKRQADRLLGRLRSHSKTAEGSYEEDDTSDESNSDQRRHKGPLLS